MSLAKKQRDTRSTRPVPLVGGRRRRDWKMVAVDWGFGLLAAAIMGWLAWGRPFG